MHTINFVCLLYALLQYYAELAKPMVCDTVTLMNKAVKEGKKVIVEGANATMLDIDFGEKGA